MKKLLLIALIICGSAKAATYNVNISINASSLGLVAGDIVNIQSGGVLTADVGFTCQKITNVTGGTFRILNTFVRVNCDTITQTGGDWNMVAADTIYCKRIAISGGSTNWVGTAARPIIIRASTALASCLFSGTSSSFIMYQVKFVNMQAPSPGIASGGVQFQGITNPALHALSYIMVDTGTLASIGNTGLKINGGYVRIKGVSGYSFVTTSSHDTIQNMSIVAQGQHGVFVTSGSHNCFIGDTIQSTIEGTSYFSNVTFGGGNFHVLRNCVLLGGTYGGIGLGGSSASDTIAFCKISGGTHEQIHIDRTNCNSWYLIGNLISGGGERGLLTGMYGVSVNNWKLYYNTIVSANGGIGKGSLDLGCITGTGCGLTATGWELVGNIFLCSNTVYGDIMIDGGVDITLSKFSYNIFNEIDTHLTGAHFRVPAAEWSTNVQTNQVGFTDSITIFNLASGATAINAGDSAYFAQVFGSINPPGDIGYYQTYSTGSGTTPATGACCIPDGSCALITQTQCTQQGGAYHGDGSVCADYDCTEGGGGPGPGPGTGPAPLSKSLAIGWLTYHAPWWATANDANYSTTLRDWAANRGALMIGANTKTDFDYMKTVNPSLKGIVYGLLGRYYKDTVFGITQDTGRLRTWGDSMATATGDPYYLLDSMVLKATGAGFTVNPNGQGNRTTSSGQVGQYLYYGPYSIRYMFDLRNYRVGQYLYSRFKDQMTSSGTDGIMMDEEGLIGVTGRQNSGDGPPMPPFNSASKWVSGFNNFNHTWGTSNFTTIGDSLSQLRNNGWGRVLGDSMRAHNNLFMPNGAAYWGPHASNAVNWTNEALGAIDAYGGALLGENYAFAAMAGNAGGALGANRHLIGRLSQVKDSGMDLAIWFECGPYDSSLGISQRRYKMGALGLMLMGTFPGTTTYYWIPNPGYNYTNFRMPQSGAPQNMAVDTTWLWSYAWGKYFGVPMTTRDSSQTGTDPTDQTYTIWKTALTNPSGTNDTLTFACGRWFEGVGASWTRTGTTATVTESNHGLSSGAAISVYATSSAPAIPSGRYTVSVSGANTFTITCLNAGDPSGTISYAALDTATTGVNVTLPGSASKKWYLLKDNSGASGIGGLASWSTTVYTGGSSVKVGNAHWLVFSSDTSLANNGVSDTTLINIGDSKIEGQSIDFTVALNRSIQVVDSFFVTLTSGSATKGVDFTDVGGWYTISPGSLSTTVSVPTTDDILVEGNETFTMTISLAKYGRIATATATGTIIENDIAGQPGTAMHFNHWRRY